MTEAIQEFFLETVGREWCVFFCSMIPIIELRGAVPMGWAMGLPWWQTFLISVLGNMVPVPFILLFINKFIKFLANSKVKFFNKLANWLLGKVEKNRGKIEKYAFWGVALFVAIPLPATGAWTGSLVAAAIDMKFWKAFFSALVGVAIAGVIMTLISYGGIAAIAGLFK
ncbi:MAG: small multi-drug export protein [Clostridia bacterium]|nr:small multi-drug export protein [Clostridia bacterium]